MQKLPILQPGDSVEIIAPASRCTDKHLHDIKDLLISWELTCVIPSDIFGDDVLCANTDELRFASLQRALKNPDTKAIICARGGYGSMRLIPSLAKVTPVFQAKIFLGMSDITALNLYLQQQWHWPIIHGALAVDKFSPDSIAAVKAMLFGEKKEIHYQASPLNSLAKKDEKFIASITGGNLSLLQTSIATLWQMEPSNKIIFIEEIGERAYRVDRILEHLLQAGLFKGAKAILFGDFLNGNEPDGSSLIEPVLRRFAENADIPVAQVQGIGHGFTNFPLPLGTKVEWQGGHTVGITCFR